MTTTAPDFKLSPHSARPTGSRALRAGLFKNSALMMACRIAAMLVSLVTVPFVIGRLGLLGYGSWEVLLSVSTITTIFQNAIGGTLLWRVSSAYGAGDKSEIRRLPGLGVAITLIMFAVTLTLVLAGRHFLVQFFHIPPELRLSAEVILPCIVGITVLGGINESLAAVLRGSQEAGYTSVIQTLAGFMNAGVLLTGLARGAGLWSLLAGYSVAAVTTGIGYYLRASYLYGWFDIRPKLPTRQDVLAMRRYLGCLSIGSFSSLLRGETDKLVLAGLLPGLGGDLRHRGKNGLGRHGIQQLFLQPDHCRERRDERSRRLGGHKKALRHDGGSLSRSGWTR